MRTTFEKIWRGWFGGYIIILILVAGGIACVFGLAHNIVADGIPLDLLWQTYSWSRFVEYVLQMIVAMTVIVAGLYALYVGLRNA